MSLREIYSSIENKVRDVENLLEKELAGDLSIVEEMGRHVFEGGGKRIRPALLCLAARALGYEGNKDVRYGAVFELVHTATLVHDDIIDKAQTRRGRQVLNREYGTTISILFGDYLYNKAMEMAIRDDDFRIVRLINQATEKMIGGEVLQHFRNFSPDQTLEEYLDLIERKTAWVFAACGKSAAMLAGADEDVSERMFEYGKNLGMAFQVIDDYFDYAAKEETLGKPVGGDLREGKITYPVLRFLHYHPEQKTVIAAAFEEKEISAGGMEDLIRLMNKCGALEETRAEARQYAARAVELLEPLQRSSAFKALRKLPEYIISREK